MARRDDYRIEDLTSAQWWTMLSLSLFHWSIFLGVLLCSFVPALRFDNWLFVAFGLLIAERIGMRILEARIRRSVARHNAPDPA